MWKKIKSIFAPKQEVSSEGEDHSGDYAVPRSRRFDMLARILAFVAAFGLWFYVVSTTTTSEEREFALVPITCRNEASLRAEHGLIVQSISMDTLNVTLMGSKQEMRALSADDVKAYVSLSDIETADEYKLTVYVDVPSGITVVSQTVRQIVVNVDRPESRVMPLSASALSLRGWSLPDDCFFGKVALSSDHLTLDGPTLALDKVDRVELHSDVIGSATGSFTVTVTPHLLDAEGNEITDDGITIREKNPVEAYVEVLKSKSVPLTVNGKLGYLSAEQLKITPALVTVTGDPKTVDGIKSIPLGEVDEKDLAAAESRKFPVTANGLTITDSEGNPVTEATVEFDLTALPTKVIAGVMVRRGENTVGTVSVTVRGVSADSASQIQAMTADDLVVFADESQPEGTLSAMTVVFSEFYRDTAYEVAVADYHAGMEESDLTNLPADPVPEEAAD